MPDSVLVRIPFSHFCRKAEWGLTQAGIPYETLDARPWQMEGARLVTAEGTVPILVTPSGNVLPDSHSILVWADEHRGAAARPLYPSAVRMQVAQWESWADDTIGPSVRREAYRALHADPRLARHFDVPYWFRLPPARRLFLAILKHYKARRFEDEDPATIRAALNRTARRLAAGPGPFLFGAHPTAADLATAALFEPLLACAEPRGFAQEPAWAAVRAHIQATAPKRTTRLRGRRLRTSDWQALAAGKP